MEVLPKGTREYLYVDVRDRLSNLQSLNGLTLTWEVIGDEDEPIDNGSALNDGMTIMAGPIDTSTLEPDEYFLFVTIDLPPESIRLGPHSFTVN